MSSPFNEEKYKALLEGLEIAIVKFSELSKVIDYRIEAEYFAHKFLEIDKAISKTKTISFTEVATFINGRPYGSDCFNCNEGVRISKIGDVTNRREISEWEYVTLDEFRAQKGRFLIDGDILMTLTGDPPDVGKVNYIYNPNNASWNQRVAKIRIKPKQTFYKNNDVLFAVLSSEFSRTQLERYAKGIRQRNLGNESLERLRIPILSNDIQNLIENFIKSSFQSLSKSRSLYSEAEYILLSELGLKDWQPNNNPVNIKQLKESFLASGRLDAEYYQPKYDALFAQLSKYECDIIKDIAHIKKSVEPGSEAYQDSGIPFVRVSDVTKFGISEPNIFLSPSDFNLNELRPKKDTILLSKDGSVGIAYKIEEDMDCITSGALLHLSIFNEDYTPDYLTLVLNSIVVQMQAERDSNGAIIQHWKPSEIEQVIIPKLPKPIQETISAKIQESFALKKESKRLLDEAKMMVEREIEKGGE